MNFLNGLLLVFLLAGGGLFFIHCIHRRDGSSVVLSAALVVLGLAEIFELILSVEFFTFALKSWYFLAKVLFWGLLGTGIVLKMPIKTSTAWKIACGVLLGLIAGFALLLLTQITDAVDWYAPERSIYSQYVDLMARNRPSRWLTNLFIIYGILLTLGFAGYAMFKRNAQRIAYLAVSLAGILLGGQELLYNKVGESLADSIHLLGGAILFLSIWYLFQYGATANASESKRAVFVSWVAVVTILIVGARYRLSAYGDICKAVITTDAGKFITLSGEDLFSIDFFTSNRPAFITYVYKLAGVDSQMAIAEVSKPDRIIPRQIYADLNCISGWQTAASILAWSILAVVLARKMRSYWLRAIIAALVLGFAYVPHLADWDSVIQSESLSFSMWTLTFAMSIEFVTRILRVNGNGLDVHWSTWLSFLLWIFILAFWGFSRDTNIYMILLIGVSSAIVLLIPAVRNNVPVQFIILVTLLSLALFGVQNSLLYRSDRWMNSFFNNLTVHILPYPEREAWFVERGLPTPDPLYEYTNLLGSDYEHTEIQAEIADLVIWTVENGAGIYTKYILTHPGWALSKVWNLSDITFYENLQPYFKHDLDLVSPYAYSIGDVLHPKTIAVIWVQLAMLLGFAGLVFFRRSNQHQYGILIVFGLFFAGELGMLFVSIHGDALGLIRHALVSVMPLRLTTWLLAILLLDGSLKSYVLASKTPQM